MKKLLFTALLASSFLMAKSVTIKVVEHIPLYSSEENCGSEWDENNILGTIVGGVAGGALGNQFGGGSGKKLATVGGAIVGGIAGNQIQDKVKSNGTCSIEKEIIGYENIGYYKNKKYSIKADKKLKNFEIEL